MRFVFPPRVAILAVCCASLLPAVRAKAADATFTGGVGTFAFSDSTVWSTGVAPGDNTPTLVNPDTAFFNTNQGATLLTIDQNRNLKSLNFQSGAGQFTVGSGGANAGNPLLLSSTGSVALELGVLTTITVNAPLVLEPASATAAGAYTFRNSATTAATTAATQKLNFAGAISGGMTSAAVTLTLAGTVGTRNATDSATAAQQSNTISGIISDGGAALGMGVTVNGTAGAANTQINAWNLTGLNTFTGAVGVPNTVLYFNSIANTGTPSALGTGSKGTITVGGFFIYTGGAATSDRTITSTGGNIFNNGTGTLTLNGAVTMTNSVTLRGTNTIIENGLLAGAGGVVTTNGLTKTNGNTLFLTNAGNNFSGVLAVSAGTLNTTSIANSTVKSALGTGATIQFGQNQVGDNIGVLQLAGAAGSGSTNRALTVNAGAANTTAAPAGAVLENTVAGQTATFSGTVQAVGTVATYISSLELRGVGNGLMSGVIGGLTGAATTPANLALLKTGTGQWELSAANIYYGATSVTGGTLALSGSLNGTSSVTVGAAGTLTTGALGTISPGLTATGATGNVTVAGTVAPGGQTIGSDVGTLSLSLPAGAKLGFQTGSKLLFGLGTTSDLISFSNADDNLSGSGTATLQLDVTQPGFSYGNVYTIFQNVTTTGFTFAGITGYDTANRAASLTKVGNDYRLSFQAIPEPGQAVLLLAGLLPLLGRRRRA